MRARALLAKRASVTSNSVHDDRGRSWRWRESPTGPDSAPAGAFVLEMQGLRQRITPSRGTPAKAARAYGIESTKGQVAGDAG